MTPDPELLAAKLEDITLQVENEWKNQAPCFTKYKKVKVEAMRRLLAAHPEWAGRNDSGCLSRPTNVSDKMALTDKAIGIVRERAGLPDGWIPLSAEEGALSKLAIELVEKSLKSKEK